MKHKIYINRSRRSLGHPETAALIKKAAAAALKAEGITEPCEIGVTLTDDEGIHAINLENRGVDAATDVLSFPMFDFTPGALPEDLSAYLDGQTGLLPLGDMAISLPRARAQAKEFGHSLKREIGYLTVHSVLHLLGYDHMDEGPMKAQMRAKEEEIMQKMDLSRQKEA